jgi:anti-anti-sigma factor
MITLRTDSVGDILVVECQGRIEGSDGALILREGVTSKTDARTIVLDLSEVYAIDDSGIALLVLLQRWAQGRDIRLKIFNPHTPVRDRLEHASSMSAFEIATLDEVMALLAVPTYDTQPFQPESSTVGERIHALLVS